jgi:hypothetical protein
LRGDKVAAERLSTSLTKMREGWESWNSWNSWNEDQRRAGTVGGSSRNPEPNDRLTPPV